MALSTDQVKQLASQGPLSTTQVQNLAATNQPTPVAPATPTAPVINAASLSPQQPFNPIVAPTYTPPVQEPITAPNVPLSREEQAAMDAITPIRSLVDQLTVGTNELAQKSYRNQQNESLGLNAAQSLSNDLYNKSQSLQQQAQGITLQKQTDIQGLQNSAQQGGANVTKGGLAPQQRAIETRANQQLLSNAIEQYNNAASYYAANGKVAAAQKAVDNAVDAEFTPKLQALAAAQANLKTALESPLVTFAQRKQLLNLQAEYDAQTQAIKDAAKVAADTGDARIKAITNNPGLSTFAHDALMAAQSPEEVAAIVADPMFGLSSMSQQDKFNQDLQIAKFQQDKEQFGLNYALDKQKLAEDKRQFDIKQSQGNDTLLSVNEAQALGVPYGTTQAEAMAMGKVPQKQATAAQETTALYANRLEQSGQILDTLDKYAMEANPVSYKLQANLPDVLNALKSGNFQSVDQAQRNFVNAVLRRESGAVISPSEFDNAKKQYFAQPGDTAETVAQKKANRDLVIQGFIQGAGSAYTPIAATANKVVAGGKEWEVGKIYNDGTSNWTVDASGNWTKV